MVKSFVMLLNRLINPWIALSTALLCFVFLSSCSGSMRRSPIDGEEQSLINRSLDASVGTSKEGRKTMMSMFTPVVIYLPDVKCVAFKANKGTIGGEFTACFRKTDDSLAFTHTEGI